MDDKKRKAKVLNIQADFLESWPCLLTGFGESRKPFYLLYIGILLLFLLTMLATAIYTLPLVWNDVIYLIAEVHFTLAVYWVISTLMLRLITDRSLKEMMMMMKQGIYNYENEHYNQTHQQIKTDLTSGLKKRINIYKFVYLTAYVSVMFLSPILSYLFIPETSRFYNDDIVNNYLPHIFYTPFDNKTLLGFAIAYLIDLTFWTIACFFTFSTMLLMTIGMIQIELHCKILNYSISNIQTRALRLYEKRFAFAGERPSIEQLLNKKEFQDCLYSCLRDNIRHHHTLIIYKDYFQPYLGPSLFSIYCVVVSVIYAALLYLLLQPLPIGMKLKYLWMLISEDLAAFIVSICGDDVINESSKLFETLYSTPWYNYNGEFKQALHIMMSGTRKPIKLRAQFLDAAASKQSFGELTKASYTLMNLLAPSRGI